MRLNYDGQLVMTSLEVTFRGMSLRVQDIVVDTGSSHTIICPDFLEEIGIRYETGDEIYEAYGIGGSVPFYTKRLDQLRLGDYIIKDFVVDVGMLPNNHKGLLGLDILKEHNFLIDLNRLELLREPI